MKKIIALILPLIITANLLAQAPQKMSYQAVIRNASDVLITSSTIGIQISILQGSASGSAVFVETHTTNTNANGLVSLEIGTGTPVTGLFSAIDWSAGPYFIKTETDPSGGTAYTISGTSQLMSVPYALFSANGSGATGATGATGVAGVDGTNGTNGIDGVTGATGIAGTNGTNGIDGITGATGAIGTNGTNGLDGVTGATGIAGTNGTNGSTGATGANGIAGTNGTNGINGSTGATGANGIAGTNGTNGTNGNTGATGIAGTNGTNGTNGNTGATGANGIAGTNGSTGATGVAGTNGTNGSTGATGIAGTNGTDGNTGATGATGTFSGSAWETSGNAGTDPSINYIGTSDNQSLVFKVNGGKAGLIDAPSAFKYNNAFGYEVLNSNTSGQDNNAFGFQALSLNTTGSGNTSIGTRSLNSNTTGSDNLAFGPRTMRMNTSGTSNIAIGIDVLGSNLIGNFNLGIGQSALNVNTASNNLAIGARALDANTTGTPNIAIGIDALGSNAIGTNNTAIGYNALLLSTSSNNVALGNYAGNTNTSGGNNTLIGYNSDVTVSTLTNATAIGANSAVSASNALVLGNAANVGIGTSNPIYGKLQVVGNTLFTLTSAGFAAGHAAYIRGNDNYSTATTPDYTWWNSDQTGMFHPAASTIAFCASGTGETVRINSAGNVGIRTTTPNGLLELGLDQGRKPGTGTWTIVSDERLKNIEGPYTKGLKELMQLQTIVYHYKNAGGRKFNEEVLKTQNVGFSAQEVQKIFPEAVGVDEDGFLNLNLHSVFVAYLNAIKEQQLQIEKLQIENAEIKAELKSEVNTLKKQNAEIIEKLNQLNHPTNSASTKK